MNEAPEKALRQAVEGLHGGKAVFQRVEPVKETFQGATVWDGQVHVFELRGHPSAQTAYAWSFELEPGGKRKFYAVLHTPAVDSPVKAVRAAIVADSKKHGPI